MNSSHRTWHFPQLDVYYCIVYCFMSRASHSSSLKQPKCSSMTCITQYWRSDFSSTAISITKIILPINLLSNYSQTTCLSQMDRTASVPLNTSIAIGSIIVLSNWTNNLIADAQGNGKPDDCWAPDRYLLSTRGLPVLQRAIVLYKLQLNKSAHCKRLAAGIILS